jgi:sigma-E factor negative regulatory protein RseC
MNAQRRLLKKRNTETEFQAGLSALLPVLISLMGVYMATEQGIVLRIDSQMAWVKTVRSSACEDCSAKGSCHAMGSSRDMEVKALNPTGARVGDRVVLSYETASFLKASFLIYVFPIILLIVGAALGQMLAPVVDLTPSVLSVLLGFAFFFSALVIVKVRANKMAKKNAYQPKVIKILNHSFLGNRSSI